MSVNYTYFGDHSAIYINIESLWCAPETMLYVNYISIENITFKKKIRKRMKGLF